LNIGDFKDKFLLQSLCHTDENEINTPIAAAHTQLISLKTT
jgi:hypothetical protein